MYARLDRPGEILASDCFAAFTTPPFSISEEGWGEFDMEITFTGLDKGGDHPILHDLNFQSARYEAKHTIVSGNIMVA